MVSVSELDLTTPSMTPNSVLAVEGRPTPRFQQLLATLLIKKLEEYPMTNPEDSWLDRLWLVNTALYRASLLGFLLTLLAVPRNLKRHLDEIIIWYLAPS